VVAIGEDVEQDYIPEWAQRLTEIREAILERLREKKQAGERGQGSFSQLLTPQVFSDGTRFELSVICTPNKACPRMIVSGEL